MAIGRQAATGDKIVDVRMIPQVAGPGVEYTDHAERAPNTPWIASEFLQRGRCTTKKKRVEDVLMTPGHLPEPLRQGKGDQKVRHGEQ